MHRDENDRARFVNGVPGARPPLATRAFVLICAATSAAMVCFYLLLSVVPQYATSLGASGIGAGLVTGALMLSTVGMELATPRIVARFGYRTTLAAGLFLLGAPALGLVAAHTMPAILAICLVRGAGLAIIVVVAASLVAIAVPPERRGEGLGVYGFVANLQAVVCLPLGIWLASRFGYDTVFIAAGVAGLAALAAVPGLPPGVPDAHETSVGVLEGFRNPALVLPAIVFFATTMAAGTIVTFLPLAAVHASGSIVAAALFVQAAASTTSRWWAGTHGDKHGSAMLLIPGALAAVAGVLLLTLIANTWAMMAGLLIFGLAFGVVQNATLTPMFDRVSPSGYDAVSAVWNIAYDAGLGGGAVLFGITASRTGYPAAFALLAALMLALSTFAVVDRRRIARQGMRAT